MKEYFINISDLIGQKLGATKRLKISPTIPSPDSENVLNEPKMKGEIILTKLENGILGDFRLKTKIELSCVRCFKKFSKTINLNFQQEFSYAGNRMQDLDIQYTIKGNKLDLLPSLEQEILLALPMKPICNRKCKVIKIKS